MFRSMMTDGAKRKKGNYIKKNSSVMNYVKIEKFSFSEIRKHPVLYPDNAHYNVFYERLQDPEHLKKSVVDYGSTQDELISKKNQSPVIFPIDFTKEWLEERRKARKRNANRGIDEDDLDLVIEEEREVEKQVDSTQEDLKKDDDISSENEKTSESVDNSLESSTDLNPVEDSNEDKEIKSNLQELGNENLSLPSPPDFSSQEASPPEDFSETEASQEVASYDNQDLVEPSPEVENMEQEKLQENEEMQLQASAAELQKLQDHLKSGVTELQKLRKEVLKKSENNFLEISTAISQALFGKVIKSDPSAFKAMVSKVLESHVGEDDIKVKVHPEILKKLQSAGVDNLDGWMEDPSLDEEQFILSKGEASIDTSLSNLIEDLVKDVDISLDDEE